MKERSIFANSAWGMFTQGVRGLVGLAFVPLVISDIGLVGYGIYSIMMLLSYSQGLAVQADLGYSNFLINWASRDGDESQKVKEDFLQRAGSLLFFLFIINFILLVICLNAPNAVASLFKIDQGQITILKKSLSHIFIANFFSMYVGVLSTWWTAKHRFALVKKNEIWTYFIFIFLAIYLLSKNPSFESLTLAFLWSQIFSALWMLIETRRTFKFVLWTKWIHIHILKIDWKDWRPFLIVRVNELAVRQSDVAIVSVFLGPEFTAMYDIALKIPSLIKGFLGKISEVIGPFASQRRNKEDMPFIKGLTEELVRIEVAIGLFFAVNMLFFGHKICEIWLGLQATSVEIPFLLACWINVFVPPASVLLSVLMGQGVRNLKITKLLTYFSIFNLLLVIPITMHFGIIGTISLTILQYIMMSASAIYYAKKDFMFSLSRGFIFWLNSVVLVLIISVLSRYIFDLNSVAQLIFLQLVLAVGIAVLLAPELRKLKLFMAKRASGNLAMQ